jgi:uncharacterized RDD family membrane protein YckC
MASHAPNLGEVHSLPPIAPALAVPYADVASRLGAYLVDIIISFCVLMAVAFTTRILFATGLLTLPQPTDPVSLWASFSLGLKLAILFTYVLALGPIYFALFESSPWQATFGKRLLGIYVTRDDRQRVSLARSSTRWLARFFCSWFGGSLVSIILMAATKNCKALHDYIAHTRVLKGRPATNGSLEVWRLLAAFGLQFFGILCMYVAAFSVHASSQARVIEFMK